MIVFFPKDKSSFSEGDLLPLFELPVDQRGEKIELNDFQWWAPTPKWDEWLKKNPRDWKAESENPIFKKSTKKIFESLVEEGSINPSVVTFEEFSSLMEEDKNQGNEISEEEAAKRYTKFVFAYNKLLKDGKVILNIDFDKLQPNFDYALILDLQGEDGADVEQSRNGYKFRRFPSAPSSKFIIGEMNESILTGKFAEGSSITDAFIQTGKYVGRLALSGVLTIAGIAFAAKVTGSLLTRMRITKILGQVIPGMKTASSIGKNSWYFVKTLGGIVPFSKGLVQSYKAGFKGMEAIRMASMLAGDARAAAGAAEATNPVGWIILAATAGQQLYNWASDKQAPRFGEIEDEGIDAQDSFSPGSIADGSEITVCWTQEAGQGGILASIQNALITNDTRTTMSLLKIGNFKGRALFYLVSIHSEMYEKMLKENPTIFVSFDQNAKFEHGILDNDDIEMEIIVPPGGGNAGAVSSFRGYCNWDDLDQNYKSADDRMLVVPNNAPKEYSFYFKSGKASREINVTGSLVENLQDVTKVKATFDVSEPSEPKNESNGSEVFSFAEFQKIALTENNQIFEEDNSDEMADAKSQASKTNLTESQKVAAYEVTKIEFADSALEGQDLPELRTFIIPNDYLEAADDAPIKVDPIQDITIKTPKRGTIIIETDEAPAPIPVAEVGATGEKEPEVEGGVPVEVTKDEVKIKYRDNPDALNAIGIPDVTKIKDKDRDDKIKFLDMVTPEEKKDLDIEDWDYIKKVKIYKDGKTGDPIMIKFKSGGSDEDRKRKIKAEDANFDTALKVANRIQAGFKEASGEGESEKD
jgi:hypothetical protein